MRGKCERKRKEKWRGCYDNNNFEWMSGIPVLTESVSMELFDTMLPAFTASNINLDRVDHLLKRYNTILETDGASFAFDFAGSTGYLTVYRLTIGASFSDCTLLKMPSLGTIADVIGMDNQATFDLMNGGYLILHPSVNGLVIERLKVLIDIMRM